MKPPASFPDFCAFSARLGQDPLRVQGPGGNTSIKENGVMWIKASGTELAHAQTADIFVAVDHNAAKDEAHARAGDGTCRQAVLDPSNTLRPSIETTFHALLDWPVVAHTHSIAALSHAVSDAGLRIAGDKLAGLPVAFVPYAKPGMPLTREIRTRIDATTQIILLANHGLIVCGPDVQTTATLMDEVEARLFLPPRTAPLLEPNNAPPVGFVWASESWIALDLSTSAYAVSGSYYPDHVVFLGPALPQSDHAGRPPAILLAGQGIALREDATSSQKAMLRCLSDVLSRLPSDWVPQPLGPVAEAELLNWDAEKYRQALAARS
jgi:rhamnose utilization protein RhaD (predicted bifunctional aldolase and dehydrogenase)